MDWTKGDGCKPVCLYVVCLRHGAARARRASRHDGANDRDLLCSREGDLMYPRDVDTLRSDEEVTLDNEVRSVGMSRTSL